MKFKKPFFTFAVALCVCMLTFCIFAEEFAPGTGSVYFVSNAAGKDTNAGTSATAPLKTLGKANAYLREAHGGTIVICGDVDISTTFAPADIGGAVVYTSEYDGVDYRECGASLDIGANMAFNNDTYFENITLELSASGISIAARCNNLGFGYGVNTVNASAIEDFTFPIIIGGFNNPSSLEESSSSNNYSIHIYNGNWNAVYGGNRRPVPNTNPVSDLSGDVAVLIKGGTFDNIVSAAGMCVHSGRVYLGISGGTFNSAVVPIRRLGEMPSDSTLVTDADFTANVLVHIDGGTFNGRFRLAESTIETTAITKMPLGDATVVVTGGTYNYADFVGYGVAGSVLLKYDPEVLNNVTIKGFPLKTTTTAMSKSDEEKATFTNPIGDKADPYVIEKDGLYYYCFSSGTTVDGTSYAGVKVAVHENLPFGELSTQIRAVFNASQTDIANAKQNYWAPELHYFDAATVGKENAGWYIYVAADDGDTKHHRMYVLRATDRENPLSDFEMVGQITDSTNKWAIDGTVMVHGGKLYFIWSGWEGDTDGYQNIYIAQMSNPWTVSSSRVLLSRPEYSWETNGYPDINEGPQVLKAPDGTVHIIYSASTSFSQYYCYGALTLTGTDPLDKASWYKSTTALFSSGNGAYGTGHGSFVKDDDGNFWMYYHANPSLTVPEGSTWWAERSTYVKPFSFT
ncbi:MAG: glycoside hydrolase family 43 protein, partial [Clostridia bacterium]|nr:glycoside hydrolase family 43 protein [Clostridia bacterium]